MRPIRCGKYTGRKSTGICYFIPPCELVAKHPSKPGPTMVLFEESARVRLPGTTGSSRMGIRAIMPIFQTQASGHNKNKRIDTVDR
jgi:hypothetical protein